MAWILSAARLAVDFSDMLYGHRMFLDRPCAVKMVELGQSFINAYLHLAKWSFDHEHALFAVKPKLHFMRHILLDLEEQVESGSELVMSPLAWDCSQNEDFIGRVCRLGRRIDGRILTKRALQNYLIKAGILYKRELARSKAN